MEITETPTLSLADYLRKLSSAGQYGHSRSPMNYYMTASYCSYYWNSHGIVPDHKTWQKVATLSKRYHQFCTYVREVVPEWHEVDRIHWMDNSIDVVEEDKDGNRRNRQITAPSGDACF